MEYHYLWFEELFRLGTDIVIYKVRSLNYPENIAYVRISKNGYNVFKTHYELKLGEILKIYGMARIYHDCFKGSRTDTAS